MLWLIGYLMIGLIFAGVALPRIVKVGEKHLDTDHEKGIALIISIVFVALLVAQLWPMWLAVIATKPFRKKGKKEESANNAG